MERSGRWRNEEGMTLVELLVSLALLGLVMVPILAISVQGARTEAAVQRRYSAQEQAYRRFREISEGLRGATELAVSTDGVAYRAGDRVVTFYLDGDALHRKTCQAGPGCPVAVDPAGGEAVLGNVKAFGVVRDRDGGLVTVRLETVIRLATKVNLRNLPQGPDNENEGG